MMKKIETFTTGVNKGLGNIIGIQPIMNEIDYTSADFFKQKMESYLTRAKESGFLNEKTVVVFPEYIGTWLVALDSSAHKARTINQAIFRIITTNLIQFILFLIKFKKIEKAIFNLKAQKISKVYNQTFSVLARDFGVTIIGGSVLLPNPEISHNKLKTKQGKLFNTSIIFKPDGTIYENIIKKVYLVEDEAAFTETGKNSEFKIINHKIGNLAIFICADSWFDEPYIIADKLKADILFVPSYLYPNDSWNNHWKGDKKKKTNLTEKEAWLKHAMCSKITQTNIKIGLNVFLRGHFWDLGSDGETTIYYKNECTVIKEEEVISNIWIDE